MAPARRGELLASRSQQMLDLLKENIRLNIQVQEAELQKAAAPTAPPRRA